MPVTKKSTTPAAPAAKAGAKPPNRKQVQAALHELGLLIDRLERTARFLEGAGLPVLAIDQRIISVLRFELKTSQFFYARHLTVQALSKATGVPIPPLVY